MDLYSDMRHHDHTADVDYLALFDVTDQATSADIHQRYRLMMMYLYHPDRYASLPEPDRTILMHIAHKQACLLNRGYALLRTPEGLQTYLEQRARHQAQTKLRPIGIIHTWCANVLPGCWHLVRQRPLYAVGSCTAVILALLWLSPWLIGQADLIVPVVTSILLMAVFANVVYYASVRQRLTHI